MSYDKEVHVKQVLFGRLPWNKHQGLLEEVYFYGTESVHGCLLLKVYNRTGPWGSCKKFGQCDCYLDQWLMLLTTVSSCKLVLLMKAWFWCCCFCINLAAISRLDHECGAAWQIVYMIFVWWCGAGAFCNSVFGLKNINFDGFFGTFQWFRHLHIKTIHKHQKSINLMPFLSKRTFRSNHVTKQ